MMTADNRDKGAAKQAALDGLTRGARGLDIALEDLAAAIEMVTQDAEVLGGQPSIRGTRIPVFDVAASVRAGIPMDEILASYPDLTKRDVELATIYARAHPPPGRARRVAETWPDAGLTSARVVNRRRDG
jgi:uncharacterized protein (DUF433 family)